MPAQNTGKSALDRLTEAIAAVTTGITRPRAVAESTPSAGPEVPLHTMSQQEFRAASTAYWAQRAGSLGSPSWRPDSAPDQHS
jgi:hypothetical protein